MRGVMRSVKVLERENVTVSSTKAHPFVRLQIRPRSCSTTLPMAPLITSLKPAEITPVGPQMDPADLAAAALRVLPRRSGPLLLMGPPFAAPAPRVAAETIRRVRAIDLLKVGSPRSTQAQRLVQPRELVSDATLDVYAPPLRGEDTARVFGILGANANPLCIHRVQPDDDVYENEIPGGWPVDRFAIPSLQSRLGPAPRGDKLLIKVAPSSKVVGAIFMVQEDLQEEGPLGREVC